MTNITKYKHSILILYELLYCNGSIEFISELVKKINKVNKNLTSLELKNRVRIYLKFLLEKDLVYIKYGKTIYNIHNINALYEIIENNWDKFENKDNVDYNKFWYSYLIEYSEEWTIHLDEIK